MCRRRRRRLFRRRGQHRLRLGRGLQSCTLFILESVAYKGAFHRVPFRAIVVSVHSG